MSNSNDFSVEVHIQPTQPTNREQPKDHLDFGEQKIGTVSETRMFGASCIPSGETKILFTLKGLGPFHFQEGEIKRDGDDQTLLHTVYKSPGHVLIVFEPTKEGPVSQTLRVSSTDGKKLDPSFDNPLRLTGVGKK